MREAREDALWYGAVADETRLNDADDAGAGVVELTHLVDRAKKSRDAYDAAIRAAILAGAVRVVEGMDTFELDRGRGYGCHCDMKREKTTEFYAGDWLDRDGTLAALRAVGAP